MSSNSCGGVQVGVPEDEVLDDAEYEKLMKKLERIQMLEKTLKEDGTEADDVQAARRQISDMRQSLKRR